MPAPTHDDTSSQTSTRPGQSGGDGGRSDSGGRNRNRSRNRRRRRSGNPGGQAQPAARPPNRSADRTPDPVVAIPPGASDTCQITGVLREVQRGINPLRAFGYADDGPMAIALARSYLGRRWVAVADFARITINVPRADSAAGAGNAGQQASYTAWLPAAAVQGNRIKPGITVTATLVSIDVSDRYRAWYCDDFRAA